MSPYPLEPKPKPQRNAAWITARSPGMQNAIASGTVMVRFSGMAQRIDSESTGIQNTFPNKRKRRGQESRLTRTYPVPGASKRQRLVKPLVLLDLPTEMVQYIASLLSPSSAAAFALTCKAVRNTIGPRWDELRNDAGRMLQIDKRDYYTDFLENLERDCPYFILCKFCCVLHRWYRQGAPSKTEMVRSTPHYWCHIFDGVISICEKYSIHYIQVKLAMRRHSFGPLWGISLDDFACDKINVPLYLGSPGRNCVNNFNAQAKIANDNLFLEVRFTVWIINGAAMKHELERYGIQICVHDKDLNHLWFAHEIKEHLGMAQCKAANEILVSQCAYCPTEFGAQWTEEKENGIARRAEIIMIWKCLGEGGTKRDWKWMSLISEEYSFYQAYNADIVRFPLGSIRAIFHPQGSAQQEAASGLACGGEESMFEKRWARKALRDEQNAIDERRYVEAYRPR